MIHRPWPLAAHVAALSVLVAALAPFLHLQTAWVGDEGAYSLQVRSLQHGQWEYDYGAQVIDPKGSWFPLATGEGYNFEFGGRFYSYVKHPTYVLLQRVAVGVVGDSYGFHLVSMVGAVLCAIAAWLLADEAAGRAQRLAFWSAATGPAMFNGFVMWGHALSAGLAGLTLVVACRLAWRRFSVLGVAALTSGVLLGGLIRAEGVLFGLALAVGLAVIAPWSIGWIRAGVASAAAAAAAAAARFGGAEIVDLVVRGDYGVHGLRIGNNPMPYFEGRLAGAHHVLFRGSEITPRANELLLMASGLTAMGAILLVTRWHRVTAVPAIAAFGAAAWLIIVRFETYPLESATGLFAAWPLAAAGIITAVAAVARRRAADDHRPFRWALPFLTVLLFVGLVIATQYTIGGGLEWGGRFLSPIGAPLAAFTALGLHHAVTAGSNRALRVLTVAALVPVAVLPIGGGLRLLERYRGEKQSFYAELESRVAPIVVIGVYPLIELPRGAWKLDDRVDWMMAPSPGDVPTVLAKLKAAGFRDVSLIEERSELPDQALSYEVVTDATGPHVMNAGWVLVRLQPAP